MKFEAPGRLREAVKDDWVSRQMNKVFRKYYLLLTGSMKFVRNDVNCETTHAKKALNA